MSLSPLVCLCHLRWAFTFQRPNHLMVRFARERTVYYVEEPIFGAPEGSDSESELRVREVVHNLWVCTPHLPAALATDSGAAELEVAELLSGFLQQRGVLQPVLWFYTPMALPLTAAVTPSVVIYDCMDELTLFLGAPKELIERERALLARADLVFTGGYSLYRAKRTQHPAVHPFPSSVDVEHFRFPSSQLLADPADQQNIPHPRVGFFGVIDERMDLELLSYAAQARPNYHFVLIGPVVKIPEVSLPRANNLHYLGSKQYAELPAYLHGWDVAIMPFALNDATRFISPTKTLEYLAADKPVVSTAVGDVVIPYGDRGQVMIADRKGFPDALDVALERSAAENRARARQALEGTSWDRTWAEMASLIRGVEELQQRRLDDTVENFPKPATLENGAEARCTTT
ncbi:MAG TPA: glycosyltransferase [Polyangiaceae bacterium]